MENNTTIKILHLITGLSTGGAERALVKLLANSDKAMFEHRVISLMDKGTQGPLLEEMGFVVHAMGMKGIASSPLGLLRLRKLVRQWQPDVIHAWMYHAGMFAVGCGFNGPKILGIRHSLHDISQEKNTTQYVIKWLAKRPEKFDAIVYNAQKSRQQHEAFGYNSKLGKVIPNGFDTDVYAPRAELRTLVRKETGVGDQELVFGNLARYHPMKDHKGLIMAFSKIHPSLPDAKMLLAGTNVNKDNVEIVQLLASLNLSAKVHLLDDRTDVSAILNAMDVYVQASLGEAFPNVLGEAMSCEVSCIATDVGDSSLIVGDTGLVVPPGNTEALAEAMLKMATMPAAERQKMGQKARQRIVDHYELKQSTAAYEQLYLRLAGKE